MIRTIPIADVSRILARWRKTYPEDVFPSESVSYECKAAKLVRHVIDEIALDISELPVGYMREEELDPTPVSGTENP